MTAVSAIKTLGTTNIDLAKSAAYLEAGRIALNKAVDAVAAKAPLMIQGYVKTPVGRLVVANMFLAAAQNLDMLKTKPVVQRLANAMVASAYQSGIQAFNIEAMIDDLLGTSGVGSVLAAAEAA